MPDIETHLDTLAGERRFYSARLESLIGQPGREFEIAAYLRLIDHVNDAAITLARRNCAGLSRAVAGV